MKGNKAVIDVLNVNLKNELTCINQFMVHANVCKNYGFPKLYEKIQSRVEEKAVHVEELITRILFLGGRPIVSDRDKLHITDDFERMMGNDLISEEIAVKAQNDGIKAAVEAGDHGSAALLRSHLEDEEKHMIWIESQISQIKRIGIQNYLTMQM